MLGMQTSLQRVGNSLYLINPAETSPGYFGLEVLEAWGIAKAASMADLTTVTVAAFAPTNWKVTICDERIEPIDFENSAKFVGLTGKISQRDRIIELAAEFRRRGCVVIIGGSYASLSSDDMRNHADILVTGEIEDIAAELFADLSAGSYRPTYVGTKPDLKLSPIPRWDLYPKGRALSGQVQTSRGCPFECEFCDVIQYLGRKQRWKEPAQITAELDVLYNLGYRSVFFADDNLTVMRRRTRAFLEALVTWRARSSASPMTFSTQVSIDVARDPEILELMQKGGFETVFIGIETPSAESLAETGKRQNLRIDLAEQVRSVVQRGIMVISGIIVGFDHDGLDIFERQLDFIQKMPVPLVSPGLLVAPESTPLHARIKAEGRLVDDRQFGAATVASTNIRPLLMSMEQLTGGMTWLLNQIFSPVLFEQRLTRFVECCGDRGPAERRPFFVGAAASLARRLAAEGPNELHLLRTLEAAAHARPDLHGTLNAILAYYCQARHMLTHQGLWNPAIAPTKGP